MTEAAQRPDPRQPHKYEAAKQDTTDWRGADATPCRVCQRPRKNSIHRRARKPRAAPVDRRRALVAEAWQERERAMLGDRDDD